MQVLTLKFFLGRRETGQGLEGLASPGALFLSFGGEGRLEAPFHRRIHAEELGLAIQELHQGLTGLHAGLPLVDGHRDRGRPSCRAWCFGFDGGISPLI